MQIGRFKLKTGDVRLVRVARLRRAGEEPIRPAARSERIHGPLRRSTLSGRGRRPSGKPLAVRKSDASAGP